MGLLKWLKNITGKKSEKELLDELHGQLLMLNTILEKSGNSLPVQLKEQLNSFATSAITVCGNFKKAYPKINLRSYKTWIDRILNLSGTFLEQCAQIEERSARAKYEEALVRINDISEDLLNVVEGYTTNKKAA